MQTQETPPKQDIKRVKLFDFSEFWNKNSTEVCKKFNELQKEKGTVIGIYSSKLEEPDLDDYENKTRYETNVLRHRVNIFFEFNNQRNCIDKYLIIPNTLTENTFDTQSNFTEKFNYTKPERLNRILTYYYSGNYVGLNPSEEQKPVNIKNNVAFMLGISDDSVEIMNTDDIPEQLNQVYCGEILPVYTNYSNLTEDYTDIVVKITKEKHRILKDEITGLISYSDIGDGKFHYRVKKGQGGIENERGLYQLIKKICEITQYGGKRKPNSRKRKTGGKRRSRRRGRKPTSK